MSPDPVVLLPPSEGKASGGVAKYRHGTFDRNLSAPREQVLAALQPLLRGSATTAASVLGVTGELLEQAHSAMGDIGSPSALYLPAYQRYTGVVWGHLAPESLDKETRQRLLIPSGLYGLTTANDDLANYRLKMSVSLPGLGKLATWWRSAVTAAVIAAAQGAPIVDLLPNEHAAALDVEEIARHGELRRVRFVTRHGGSPVGHHAKAVKGIFARRVVETSWKSMSRFRWEGWSAERDGRHLVVVAP